MQRATVAVGAAKQLNHFSFVHLCVCVCVCVGIFVLFYPCFLFFFFLICSACHRVFGA